MGSSNFLWYQMLTQQGYIVACVDNRGTGARGSNLSVPTNNWENLKQKTKLRQTDI